MKTAVLHKFPDNANIENYDKDFGWAEFDCEVELRSGEMLEFSEQKNSGNLMFEVGQSGASSVLSSGVLGGKSSSSSFDVLQGVTDASGSDFSAAISSSSNTDLINSHYGKGAAAPNPNLKSHPVSYSLESIQSTVTNSSISSGHVRSNSCADAAALARLRTRTSSESHPISAIRHRQ